MLMTLRHSSFIVMHVDRLAVETLQCGPDEVHDRGRDVGVRGDGFGGVAYCDAGAADDEGDVDVCVEAAFFARVETYQRSLAS